MKINIIKISLILIIMLVTSCGDPVFRIKHTVSFESSISHECILASAKAINVRIHSTKNAKSNFDEYRITSGNTKIYGLWFRNNRKKIELSTFGIGFAEKERDTATCKLINSFKESLINTCGINRKTIIINKEYIRSSCE